MRQTKVLVPPPSASLYVPRTRLDELADGCVSRAVTIVRAGGGFGKTTLMRTWAARVRDLAHVAWLSLEPFDATPTVLIEGINASIQHALPDVGASVAHMLGRGIDDARRLVSALSNELLAWTGASRSDIVLFLDDVQFVADSAAAVSVLSDLTSALPDRVHLVLATRSPLRFPPLGKLRAAGRMLEVDEHELRFTADETLQLISDARVAPEYQERTEGWPIALALLAQVHQRAPERPDVALAGSREALFQFLAEEVTGRLDPQLAAHLYRLAIPETIDGDIAAALLDLPRVESAIGALSNAGIHFGRVDEQSWRLHALFRAFLIDRFREEDPDGLRTARLHYAELLRSRGRKMEALHQLLDADEYESIVTYSEEALVAIHLSDRFHQVIDILSRVPEAIFQKNPVLYRFYAKALVRDGRPELAREQLRKCYEAALNNQDFKQAFFAQLNLGMNTPEFMSLTRGEHLESLAYFQRALDLANSEALRDEPRFVLYARWHLGLVSACRGDFDDAIAHLEIAEKIERGLPRHLEPIIVEISTVYGWKGDWERSLEYAELAEEFFRTGGGEAQIGRALAAQAKAHVALASSADRSVDIARAAVASLSEANQEDELPGALATLARAYLAQTPPDLEAARTAVSEGERWLERYPNRGYAFEIGRAAFLVELASGHGERAKERTAALRRLSGAHDDPWQQAMTHFCEGRRLWHLNDDGAEERFSLAAQRLDSLQDRYHAAIATLHVMTMAARANRLDYAELEAFLTHDRSVSAALRASEAASASLLEWVLRSPACSENVATPLAAALRTQLDGVIAVAQDARVAAHARAVALRTIAHAAPHRARAIVAAAANDADAVLASTARALLDYLPSPEVPDLLVEVVGHVRAVIGSQEIVESDDSLGRRKAAELLRFLAIADAPVTKAQVVAALWPDNPTVLDTTFRVTLHQLRRALQPDREGAGDYIDYDGTIVGLRRATFAGTDASRAQTNVKQAHLLVARDAYAEALPLVCDALETFARVPYEHEVDEWLRPHVRRWRVNAVAALRLRAVIESHDGLTYDAISRLEAALLLEPLDEDVVTELLDLLTRAGRLDSARVAFEEYRRRLTDQLGAAPAPHLVERYGKIVSRASAPSKGDILSAREREVVRMIARGSSNKQIAAELGLSVWTVNNHVAKILKKLNVESRIGAVAAAGALDG